MQPWYWRTGGGQALAIRKRNMKLVQLGKKPAELYDLSADIAEKTDLGGPKGEVAAALQKELDAWNATLVEPKWEPLEAPRKK